MEKVKENNVLKKFYLIAICITWFLWTVSMILSNVYNVKILHNEGFYSIFKNGFNSNLQLVIYVIFSLAVYGPVISWFLNKDKCEIKKEKLDYKSYFKWISLIVIYPLILFGLSVLITQVMSGFSKPLLNLTLPLWFIPIILIQQLLTSGTEEFGWRGFLQPMLEKKYSVEKAGYITGLLWSIWHYPFIIFMNYTMGVGIVISSLIGFTLMTIPQTFVFTYLYKKTNNIFLCVLFHAWCNVSSYYILAISPVASLTSTIVAVLTWIIANKLIKKMS
jgi:membrane protease YdiL (CAAX protease family)